MNQLIFNQVAILFMGFCGVIAMWVAADYFEQQKLFQEFIKDAKETLRKKHGR